MRTKKRSSSNPNELLNINHYVIYQKFGYGQVAEKNGNAVMAAGHMILIPLCCCNEHLIDSY